MYAARLMPGGHELEYREVPEPIARPGWAVVKVEAAGLCHTDIHVMDGATFSSRTGVDYSVTRPITLGHEVAGTVVSVGDPSDASRVGARVAVGGRGGPRTTPGMHIDGGFAEFCAVPVSALVDVPPGVSTDAAAIATDSVNTAYGAVVRAAQVEQGSVVVVIGLGGLGINAVRISALRGATVFGVDINERRFGPAIQAGAQRCTSNIGDLESEKPTIALDFVGGDTTAQALDTVTIGGRVVLVGLGAETVTLDPSVVVLGRKSLIGSLGSYSTQDFVDVLGLLSTGDLNPATENVDFADLNTAYDRLRAGDVEGRLVTRPRALT